MIIWSGLGFLVPLIFIVLCIGTFIGLEPLTSEEFIDANSKWLTQVLFLVCGAIFWFLGNLIKKKTGKIMIDPETKQEVRVGGNHTFFFIPIRYWGIICVLWAIFLWVSGLFK
jgi:hypothetical protein